MHQHDGTPVPALPGYTSCKVPAPRATSGWPRPSQSVLPSPLSPERLCPVRRDKRRRMPTRIEFPAPRFVPPVPPPRWTSLRLRLQPTVSRPSTTLTSSVAKAEARKVREIAPALVASAGLDFERGWRAGPVFLESSRPRARFRRQIYRSERSMTTGGRCRTSCLVMWSLMPSWKSVTAVIGIATSLRPNKWPSCRST